MNAAKPTVAGGRLSLRATAGRRRAAVVDVATAAGLFAAMLAADWPGLGVATLIVVLLALAAGLYRAAVLARRALSHRAPRSRRTARRPVRVLLVLSSLVAVAAAGSYVSSLSRPSNSSVGIRSVEWLRDNGAAWVVSDAENVYYSITAPAAGGPALRRLPSLGVAQPPRRFKRAYLPHAIRPLIHPALRGEGVWLATRAHLGRGAAPPVLVTSLRPDLRYPRTVVGLAWIAARRTRVALQPGLTEPPGAAARFPGEVPPSMRGGLLATFNSGFKHSDGTGGFFSAGRLAEPLVDGQGTVIGTRDGRVDIRAWHGGARPSSNTVFARQNLPLIVDHGSPSPNLSDGPQWGATLGNAVLVWRSGLGVDRRGDLIYAAGDHLSIGTLARALARAGAVRAIELDINSYWVSFISYRKTAAREPRNLLPSMTRPASRYLSPDDRDFFAVYHTEPGEKRRVGVQRTRRRALRSPWCSSRRSRPPCSSPARATRGERGPRRGTRPARPAHAARAAASPAARRAPEPHPPFAVGIRRLALVDRSRRVRFPGRRPQPRPLTTFLRYPAAGAPGPRDEPAAPAAGALIRCWCSPTASRSRLGPTRACSAPGRARGTSSPRPCSRWRTPTLPAGPTSATSSSSPAT